MEISSSETLIRKGMDAMSGKWGHVLPIFIVYFCISAGLQVIPYIGGGASLIIAGPLALGFHKFVLNISRDRDTKMEQVFDGFNYFSKALITHLLMIAYILLYTLLLIIPGIIKGIAYSQVFYLLADDPTLEPRQALDESERLMDGHKMEYFLLSLVFMALAIACMFTFGLGFFWLFPVMTVTFAKFYDELIEYEGLNEEDDILNHLV